MQNTNNPFESIPSRAMPKKQQILSKVHLTQKLKSEFEIYMDELKDRIEVLKRVSQTLLQTSNLEKLEYSLYTVEKHFTNIFMIDNIEQYTKNQEKKAFKLNTLIEELRKDLIENLKYNHPFNVSLSLGPFVEKAYSGNYHLLKLAIKNALYFFILGNRNVVPAGLFLKITLIAHDENKVKLGFSITDNQFCTSLYFNNSFNTIDEFLEKNKTLSHYQESSIILIDLLVTSFGVNAFISQSSGFADCAINFTCEFDFTQMEEVKSKKYFFEEKKEFNSMGNILIVDDSPVNQKFLSAITSSLGYNSFIAKDGKEAIEFSKYEKYDLIFMDSDMPFYSGEEATSAIRQLGNINQETPIILQSSKAIDSIAFNHQEGFTDAILKPYNEEEVKTIILKYTKKSIK